MANIKAAQYLRVSTDQQRYSIDNQAAIISAYADLNGIDIVQTYTDNAKSGVSISGRAGLKSLLSDVIGGTADFGSVLVYDVSRWGRFQDPDQAATYEFLCREAGIRVVYCAELFGDDDSLGSTILKHLKRVMAGEYSRELAAKVRYAQKRQAQLGFSQGGYPPLGVARQLQGADGKIKGLLRSGERKAMAMDRVVWVHGEATEISLVQRIFRLFAKEKYSIGRIIRDLDQLGPPARTGPRWSRFRIRAILANEIYIGLYVYNRRTKPFGSAAKPLPSDQWVRVQVFPPIVSTKLFREAQRRLESRRPGTQISDCEMLENMECIHREHGRVSAALLGQIEGGPTAGSYIRRFGSLFQAYDRVGFKPDRRATFGRGREFVSNEEMLDHLRRIDSKNGYVSSSLIAKDDLSPCTASYAIRFGSLSEAYRQAGLQHERHILQLNAQRRRCNVTSIGLTGAEDFG